MGGFPVKPFVVNWLEKNAGRTVSLVEMEEALPQLKGNSIRDAMRRLATEKDSGVTVVKRGNAWRYDPNATVPPEASEVTVKVADLVKADVKVQPPFLEFKQVGWSAESTGGLLGRRLPLVDDNKGNIYRCNPV